jgi:hypothetical protein
MRPPSPFWVFTFLHFRIGLPKKWAIKISSKYMWGPYRKYIRVNNIIHALKEKEQ